MPEPCMLDDYGHTYAVVMFFVFFFLSFFFFAFISVTHTLSGWDM
jgi:hypothetical protein